MCPDFLHGVGHIIRGFELDPQGSEMYSVEQDVLSLIRSLDQAPTTASKKVKRDHADFAIEPASLLKELSSLHVSPHHNVKPTTQHFSSPSFPPYIPARIFSESHRSSLSECKLFDDIHINSIDNVEHSMSGELYPARPCFEPLTAKLQAFEHVQNARRDHCSIDAKRWQDKLKLLADSRLNWMKDAKERMIKRKAQAKASKDPVNIRCAFKLKALSPTQEDEAIHLLNPRKKYVIIDKFNIEINSLQLACLQNGEWLNDNVINIYMEMLSARSRREQDPDSDNVPPYRKLKCHFFNTFFFSKLAVNSGQGYRYANVKRWTRRAKVDIFVLDRVFVPININNTHWCLGVIDMVNKRFKFYDSLGGSNSHFFKSIRQYVMDESLDKRKKPFDMSDWHNDTPHDIPHQENCYDCGVFLCKFADYFSEDLPLQFEQANMEYFRKKMALEIQAGVIL